MKNPSAPKTVSADTKNFNKITMKTKKNTEAMIKDQNLTPYLTSTTSDSLTPVLDEISEMLGIDAKRNPSLTFWNIFFNKGYISKKEFLDATGLSERWYRIIIDDYYNPNCRKIRTSSVAHQTLLRHLERQDLRFHQRLISELVLKVILFVSWAERIEKHSYNEDIGDDELGNAPTDPTQYLITVEELEDAMNYWVAHMIDTGKYSAA